MSKWLSLAQLKFGTGRRSGRSDEWIFKCPSCGKEKLYVNVRSGAFLCFRCYPNVRGFLREAGSNLEFLIPSGSTAPTETSESRSNLNVDWYPINRPPKSLLEEAVLDYLLRERCLTWSQVSLFKLGVSHSFLAVSIPLGAHFFALRFLYNANSKYLYSRDFKKSKILFNYERVLASGSKRVFVFEGVFDVICARPFDSVAILGSFLSSEQINLLSRLSCNELVVCLDPDVEFEKQVEGLFLLQERFSGVVLRGLLPGNSDPGDLGKDFISSVMIVPWDQV